MKKRAFVRYSKQGKIVPGSLILTSGSFPKGPSTWNEVPADLCCETPCIEPLIMEVIPNGGFYEFGFRVNIGNTVKGTIDWGDGTSETFDLTGPSGTTYFGHNYTTPDPVPRTVKTSFISTVGFDNLEIGDEPWKVSAISDISTVFAGSSIQQVDADGSLLTSLNVSGLTTLQQLFARNSPNLSFLNVQGCTGLVDAEVNDAAFVLLDFTGCTALEVVDIFDNPNLVDIILTDCPNILFFDANNCALTESVVDYIITTLDNNGLSNGFLDLRNNTAPSAGVAGNITNLTNSGWNVLTD